MLKNIVSLSDLEGKTTLKNTGLPHHFGRHREWLQPSSSSRKRHTHFVIAKAQPVAIHLPETEAAKAHMDCRVEIKISPRNDIWGRIAVLPKGSQ
ncbi:MAG: hypothetical protein V6Z78_04610 [Holosporaceae bacterium]